MHNVQPNFTICILHIPFTVSSIFKISHAETAGMIAPLTPSAMPIPQERVVKVNAEPVRGYLTASR